MSEATKHSKLPTVRDIDTRNHIDASLLEVALEIAVRRLKKSKFADGLLYYRLLDAAAKSPRCDRCRAYGADDTCECCNSTLCCRCTDYGTYEDVVVCRDTAWCDKQLAKQ